MPKKVPKTPEQAEEGEAQVAATPATRKRAPRKKASQPSEVATPGPSTTAAAPSTAPVPKRKRNVSNVSTGSLPTDLVTPSKRPRATPTQPAQPSNAYERRAKPYLEEPPDGFIVRMQRLLIDRLFILGHAVTGMNDSGDPVIAFDIVGSTGNMYKTTIRKVPICTCPDAKFRRAQCKHICYVLAHALEAPKNLQYQQSFLSSELREIWEASPLHRLQLASIENEAGRRKPIEGDCPICFMGFEANEEVVWCEAACGNNIHKNCFSKWAELGNQNPVRCVYCRTEWKSKDTTHDVERIRRSGIRGSRNGYINVAHRFGRRGSSTYLRSSTSQQSSSSG